MTDRNSLISHHRKPRSRSSKRRCDSLPGGVTVNRPDVCGEDPRVGIRTPFQKRLPSVRLSPPPDFRICRSRGNATSSLGSRRPQPWDISGFPPQRMIRCVEYFPSPSFPSDVTNGLEHEQVSPGKPKTSQRPDLAVLCRPCCGDRGRALDQGLFLRPVRPSVRHWSPDLRLYANRSNHRHA